MNHLANPRYYVELILASVPMIMVAHACYHQSFLVLNRVSIRYFFMNILVIAILILDLFFYLYHFRVYFIYGTEKFRFPIFLQLLFVAVAAFLYIRLLKAGKNSKSDEFGKADIVEAFHEFPSGLAFAKQNGVPILINRKMHELVKEILQEEIVDVCVVWRKLKEKSEPSQDARDSEAIFTCKDKTIWRFDRTLLTGEEKYIQLMAVDISVHVNLLKDLESENRKIMEQNRRIAQIDLEQERISKEEELMDTKMSLHRVMGDAITGSRLFAAGKSNFSLDEIIGMWEYSLELMESYENTSKKKDVTELMYISNLLGCEIHFPDVKLTNAQMDSFYFVIRECLNNAVKHARAKNLYIEGEDEGKEWHFRIFDDGVAEHDFILEGGGITDIRAVLEKADARMHMEWGERFILHVYYQK